MRRSALRARSPLPLAALAAVTALAACGGGDGGTAPQLDNPDPAAARLETADLAHFLDAYDAGASTALVQRLYLDRASPALKDFVARRQLTAASIAGVVQAYPRWFADATRGMRALAGDGAIAARVHADFARLKALYPPAVFPPVHFLVGRFSTGGTIGSDGLYIGTEFYTGSATAPRDELGFFQRVNVHPVDSLPLIVAHELAHIQQSRAGNAGDRRTLLDQALHEGAADFVGELVSGGQINGRIHAWALPREHEVWVDFQREMDGTDVSRWLYNQAQETADRPGDLGYFVGYRIAKAYYDGHADRAAALRDIIAARDARAFLAQSGYAP